MLCIYITFILFEKIYHSKKDKESLKNVDGLLLCGFIEGKNIQEAQLVIADKNTHSLLMVGKVSVRRWGHHFVPCWHKRGRPVHVF